MYNTEGRRCPVHPTVIRSCPICAEPAPDGYLPENYVAYSQDFGVAPWGSYEISLFPSGYHAPDGSFGPLILPSLNVTEHFVEQVLPSMPDNQLVNISCWGLSGYLLFLSVVQKDNATVSGGVFECLTPFMLPPSVGVFNPRQSERYPTDFQQTWTRCSLSVRVGAGAFNPRIRLQAWAVGGVPSTLVFPWDTFTGLGIFGAQVTLGPELREYRRTLAIPHLAIPNASHLPDNAVIDGINYQAETAIAYNTIAPPSRKHDPMLGLAEQLGLDEHWDDPRDRVPPPPLLLPIPGL